MRKSISKIDETISREDGTIEVKQQFVKYSKSEIFQWVSGIGIVSSALLTFLGFIPIPLAMILWAATIPIGMVNIILMGIETSKGERITIEHKEAKAAIKASRANAGKHYAVGKDIGVILKPATMDVSGYTQYGEEFVRDSSYEKKLPTHFRKRTAGYEDNKAYVKTEYIETPLTQWETIYSSANKIRATGVLDNV